MMKSAPRVLLRGEQVLATKNANFVITSSEYDLARFPHDFLLKRLGFDGQEALGGQLHVTSHRLIFKAHRANRVHGQLSIFLPEITGLENKSSLAVKRLVVATRASQETFIVWGVTGVIETIDSARRAFGSEQGQSAWTDLQKDPTALGDGMQYSHVMDRLVTGSAKPADELADIAHDPLAAATELHLLQFWNELQGGS